jgi:hypothetical protein
MFLLLVIRGFIMVGGKYQYRIHLFWLSDSYHSAWSLSTHSFFFWRVKPIQLFCTSARQSAWKYTLDIAVKIYESYQLSWNTGSFKVDTPDDNPDVSGCQTVE